MRRHLRRWLASLYGDSKKKLHCWCYCNELTYRRHCGARRPVRAEHSSRIQRPLDRREAPRSAEVSGRKTLPTSSSQPLLQLFIFLNFRINNNIISAIFHQVYTKSVLYICVCDSSFFFFFIRPRQTIVYHVDLLIRSFFRGGGGGNVNKEKCNNNHIPAVARRPAMTKDAVQKREQRRSAAMMYNSAETANEVTTQPAW